MRVWCESCLKVTLFILTLTSYTNNNVKILWRFSWMSRSALHLHISTMSVSISGNSGGFIQMNWPALHHVADWDIYYGFLPFNQESRKRKLMRPNKPSLYCLVIVQSSALRYARSSKLNIVHSRSLTILIPERYHKLQATYTCWANLLWLLEFMEGLFKQQSAPW